MRTLKFFFSMAFGIALPLSLVATAAAAEKEGGIADFAKLSAERDWPWWRGPSRNGVAEAANKIPLRWSETQNVIWKTPVPGRGHSSPIVVGERVFLTTADKQVHWVLSFDRGTGKPGWQTEINRGGFPARNHPKNTEATSTLACDGERLFATFFHHESIQATALDLEGKQQWQKTVGPFNPKRYEYGYAPSPVIYRGTVIIAAEHDGDSYLKALDRRTGEQVWRTPRPPNISFSSPVVAHVGGRDQLLISGGGQIASYDPATGDALWSAAGASTATCGTIVWEGDTVYASGGYPQSETVALRASDRGKVLWRNQQKCYEQSMLAVGGHLYALNGNGILYCWRGDDGQEMWKKRLYGPVSSSPVLAGGLIYWANERGMTYVFKPNPKELELLAENQLGEESFASPAVCGGRIYLRTATGSQGKRQEFLYCLGE